MQVETLESIQKLLASLNVFGYHLFDQLVKLLNEELPEHCRGDQTEYIFKLPSGGIE